MQTELIVIIPVSLQSKNITSEQKNISLSHPDNVVQILRKVQILSLEDRTNL